MIIIIIGLIVLLIIGVVIVNAMQQHKQKQEQEKRTQSAKYKAIIDESEQLITNLSNIPSSPALVNILHKRSLNAAKEALRVTPDSKPAKQKIQELDALVQSSTEAAQKPPTDDNFVVPEDEQQLVTMLQTIKKLRAMLKSEKSKGALDTQLFSQQDLRLDGMQLRIGVESVLARGKKALAKDMLGSARQYFEKALQTLNKHPNQSEYTQTKRSEIQAQLEEIATSLKVANAEDAAKKAKDEEDDLDMLFQPKKKW